MSDAQKAIEYVRTNSVRYLNELKEFIAIPSISTLPEHKSDVQRGAEWVAAQLRSMNMDDVQIIPTPGHPVVYGEWLGAGNSAPTIMIYGHYDVQPVDPIELWESDPFDATVRDDYIYARGASDMKGQVLTSLKAVEAIVRTTGLPVNIKWMVEGEEEIGSHNLEEFIKNNIKLLACDYCLNPDAGMIGMDMPTITTGLRGLAYFELKVFGPSQDLHSGLFGGTIHNPAQALIELVAGMHGKNGRITIPGFYDKVRKLSKKERADFKRLPTNDKEYLKLSGVPKLWGESQFTSVERVGARPSLDVNGLLSGFTGEGSKTVLPAWAMAKLSFRLVPDQTPGEIGKKLTAYLKKNAPKTIKWELINLHNAGAALVESDSEGIKALSKAFETVWGRHPYFRREGGSIGSVVLLQQYIGADSLLNGFSLPGDNFHAPNERLHLPSFYKGIEATTHFFYNFN